MNTIYDNLRDELLVLRCQAGDRSALDALIQRWHGRLLRHARRYIGGNGDHAEDIVQDAWLAIVRELHRVSDTAAFPSWVYRIVQNKCHDWARKQRMEQRIFAAETVDLKDYVPAPTVQSRETEALSRALACLDQDDRTLVALYYFEELSVTQIAQVFAIPTGTVKSRLHRCRGILRTHLERNCHD